MKICFISMFPLNFVGGSNTYALQLVKNIAALGNEITLVVPHSSLNNSIESLDGVRIFGIPTLQYPGLQSLTFWLESRMLADSILKAGSFDIIHFNDISGFLYRPHSIPSVVTIHHSARALQYYLPHDVLLWAKEFRVQQGIIPIIEKQVINNATRVITVSNLTKSSVIANFKKEPHLVDVVYNGLSDAYLAPQRMIESQTGRVSREEEFMLLYVGRPERRKGFDILLTALKKAIKINPRIVLAVAGIGNWDKYKKEISNSNLYGHIFFRGKISQSEILRLYQNCDAVVLPSYLEGFGLSIVEGMAFGKPVIASKWSGVREIMTKNKSGFVIDPMNPDSLTEAIIFLAENPEIAGSMGEYNRSIVKDLTWKNTANQTLKVYQKCLSR